MFSHNLDGNYTQVPEGSVSKQQILKSTVTYNHLHLSKTTG